MRNGVEPWMWLVPLWAAVSAVLATAWYWLRKRDRVRRPSLPPVMDRIDLEIDQTTIDPVYPWEPYRTTYFRDLSDSQDRSTFTGDDHDH